MTDDYKAWREQRDEDDRRYMENLAREGLGGQSGEYD